jgi:hypothetical protein
MQNECVICFNNIDNAKECISIYNFHQECNCFYNVHGICLIKWIKKHNSCIHCHKPLSYTIKNKSDASNMISETNSLVIIPHQPFQSQQSSKIDIFKCCNIL